MFWVWGLLNIQREFERAALIPGGSSEILIYSSSSNHTNTCHINDKIWSAHKTHFQPCHDLQAAWARATLRIIKIPSDPDSTEQGSSCLSFVVIRSGCLLGSGPINELSAGACCAQPLRPSNDVLTIHILTGLWHFYGDTRWEPTTLYTMMQSPMPHNLLPSHTISSLHSDHILKTAIKPHSGAPGSILKILCILKLPNKKEKFVFIIQNSFQLSRRDCEVFNKQNSAAAWGREGIPPLCYIPLTREQKETENCSRGRSSSVHNRTDCRDKWRKVWDKDQQV